MMTLPVTKQTAEHKPTRDSRLAMNFYNLAMLQIKMVFQLNKQMKSRAAPWKWTNEVISRVNLNFARITAFFFSWVS